MDEDLSELERWEQLKKWWSQNYPSIFLGAFIAVATVGGWRYWQYRTEARSEAASSLFTELTGDIGKHDDAAALKTGQHIMDDYADTPYATQAALALANMQANAGKFDVSGKLLEWVLHHGKDDGLKLVARLRLARVELASNDAQGALDTLAAAQDPGSFAPLYDALRGDIYVKFGKADEARAAYAKALAAWTDELGDRSLVQEKLDALPPAAKPAPVSATKAKS